jgi:hypothetical protein
MSTKVRRGPAGPPPQRFPGQALPGHSRRSWPGLATISAPILLTRILRLPCEDFTRVD